MGGYDIIRLIESKKESIKNQAESAFLYGTQTPPADNPLAIEVLNELSSLQSANVKYRWNMENCEKAGVDSCKPIKNKKLPTSGFDTLKLVTNGRSCDQLGDTEA